MPNTTEIVYYTAYWKNRLGELNNGLLFLNKSSYMLDSNYPCPSSSWTATEIWNKGLSYIAPLNSSQIQINTQYNTVGIDISPPIDQYKLNVNGAIYTANDVTANFNLNAKGTFQGFSGAGVFLSYESYGGRLESYDYNVSSYKNIAIAPNGGNLMIGTSSVGASKLKVVGLPTSSAGLSSGDVWNNAGVLNIIP